MKVWSVSLLKAVGITYHLLILAYRGPRFSWDRDAEIGIGMGEVTEAEGPVPITVPATITGGVWEVSLTPPTTRQGQVEPGIPTATALIPGLPLAEGVVVRVDANGMTGMVVGSLM